MLVVGGLSWKQEKARVYTPLIILLVVMNALRAVTQWSILRIFELLLELLLVYLFVTLRVFNLPENFSLYLRNNNGEKLSRVGYAEYRREEGVDLAIYYPTDDEVDAKPQASWYPHWNYTDSIYESVHIDPRRKRSLPKWLVDFCLSYLRTYKQHAYLHTKLLQHERHKVVLMSHGLAAHKNMMSCYACWYAARGWIVVSVAHRHDEICVDFRSLIEEKEKCHQYIYDRRNASLRTRNKEFKAVFNDVANGLLNKIFGSKVDISEVMMFGHSFGGTTVLSSGSRLTDHSLYSKVSRYVCLDPWLFPLSEKCYSTLHKPVLFINTDNFVKTNPEFYELHNKKRRFGEANQLLTKFYIRYSDHLHHSDAIYVFGTLLKVMGTISHFRYSTFFNELTVYAMFLFEKGRCGTDLIADLNTEIGKVRENDPPFIVEDNKQNWTD